jgi:hypothetical protein
MDRATLAILINLDDRTVKLSEARDFFDGCYPQWQSFVDTHNLNWKDVVRHGLKASTLLATNDAMATQLLTYVYRDKL